MAQDTRSLWEQFDSEVEPWRRGRFVLVSIGGFYFLVQALVLVGAVREGNLQALLAFSSICAVFWLQFYFIWIGVQWIRWLVGAWNGLTGFCFLIWGWRDENGLLIVAGPVNLLVATYFCLSSSVYFFAKHQQEKRNWLHSLLVGAVFLLLCTTCFIGAIGLMTYRAHIQQDAIEFTQKAAEHIYTDQDREWMFAHFSPNEVAAVSPEGLNGFFRDNVGRIGPVLQISTPNGPVWLVYHFPAVFIWKAQLAAEGRSGYGPVRIHFWITDTGSGWIIDRTWSERSYTEQPPDYR